MTQNYEILLNAPKEIPITAEQHDKLSIIELSSFMVNYPIAIADKGDHLELFCRDWKGNYLHDMPRFKGITGLIYPSVEIACFKIPKTTKLYQTIQKYFTHLYFKKSI